MTVTIWDGVLPNPDDYVKEILKGEFIDIDDGPYVFKGIQPRESDIFSYIVKSMFKGYSVAWNFVRQSPVGQQEPNFIHTDEMMGDKTVLLYLNKTYPQGAGTTLYDENDPMCVIKYKYNRMCVFDSKQRHSRNLEENFGEGTNARLVQVIFLKHDSKTSNL